VLTLLSLTVLRRYCRVDEDSCCLLIGKTKDSQNPTSIDLKLVVEMKAYEKVRKRERARSPCPVLYLPYCALHCPLSFAKQFTLK
jgi:hypothetical protein